MRIILFGPQASGKGTQSKLLARVLEMPAISTGDLFREEIQRGSARGKRAEAYMNRGELVPDDLTLTMFQERFARDDTRNGFVLDGFPRNTVQAEALDVMTTIDVILVLDLPEEDVLERMSGRLLCSKNHIYHTTTKPPKKDGVCDIDGLPLKQRDDETPNAIRTRLAAYHVQTTPLVDRYRGRDLPIIEIDSRPSIDIVHTAIMEKLAPYR